MFDWLCRLVYDWCTRVLWILFGLLCLFGGLLLLVCLFGLYWCALGLIGFGYSRSVAGVLCLIWWFFVFGCCLLLLFLSLFFFYIVITLDCLIVV